jgi:hypothetical protein
MTKKEYQQQSRIQILGELLKEDFSTQIDLIFEINLF